MLYKISQWTWPRAAQKKKPITNVSDILKLPSSQNSDFCNWNEKWLQNNVQTTKPTTCTKIDYCTRIARHILWKSFSPCFLVFAQSRGLVEQDLYISWWDLGFLEQRAERTAGRIAAKSKPRVKMVIAIILREANIRTSERQLNTIAPCSKPLLDDRR